MSPIRPPVSALTYVCRVDTSFILKFGPPIFVSSHLIPTFVVFVIQSNIAQFLLSPTSFISTFCFQTFVRYSLPYYSEKSFLFKMN